MACPCSSNTLRLFVRSLARIDLESAPQRHSLRPHTTARNFTSFASRHFQNSARSNSNAEDEHDEEDKWLPFVEGASAPQSAKSTGWPQRRRAAGDDYQPHVVFEKSGVLEGYEEGSYSVGDLGMPAVGTGADDGNGEDAFLGITDATLDSLAVESRRPRKSKDPRGRRPDAKDMSADAEVTPTIRRMAKPKMREMQIHFSAPRSKDAPERQAVVSEKRTSSAAPSTQSVDDGRPSWAGPDWEDRRPAWAIQKAALKEKFPEGWNPRKRLSPDALDGIRALHKQFPAQYPSAVLANKFEVSVEAIRRILRTNWTPNEEEECDRKKRWFSRGEKVWGRMADLGMKPPKQWREKGIGYNEDGSAPKWARARAKTWTSGGAKSKRVLGIRDGLERSAERDDLDISDRIM